MLKIAYSRKKCVSFAMSSYILIKAKNGVMKIKNFVKTNISLKYLIIIFLVGLVGFWLAETTKYKTEYPAYEAQLNAAEIMESCEKVLKEARLEMGIDIDRELDLNQTGLIGGEFTELTTTVGNLDAKRTATNPNFASLLVRYFFELGLEKGDTVYIGASGSFPSLVLATLSASRAMELKPVLIYSVGSSMYGANIPRFTFLEMIRILDEKDILENPVVAVSMGGNYDRAEGMFFPDSRKIIMQSIDESGVAFIYEENLAASIKKRLEIYKNYPNGKCFVNIGGAATNFGNTSESLEIPNGLNLTLENIPSGDQRGLMFEFAELGLPVIHLLNIRDLAMKSGLPIDPVPLPAPGDGEVYMTIAYRSEIIIPFVLIELILILIGRKKQKLPTVAK